MLDLIPFTLSSPLPPSLSLVKAEGEGSGDRHIQVMCPN
jgi:hypothetical protein